MCGRYVNARTDADIAVEFAVAQTVGDQPEPSWNIAPTQTRRIIVEHPARDPDPASDEQAPPAPSVPRTLRSARWGLVPSWAKDLKIGQRLINARSETVTEKPAFRAAAARRRCLVPAEGYYEWMHIDGHKTPYFLHRDENLLGFAGLYELWPDPDTAHDDPGRWLWSYTILTRPAPDALGHVHDRSPIVVPADLQAAWLNPTLTASAEVSDLLADIPDPDLTPRQVSTQVNSVRHNGAHLLDPAPR